MPRGRGRSKGGKRKFGNEQRPKQKKSKFDYRTAAHIKERRAKNDEIEKRRRIIEEKNAQERELETDSDDEPDNMKTLLDTFSLNNNLKKSVEFSSEDEDSDIADDVDVIHMNNSDSEVCNDDKGSVHSSESGSTIKVAEDIEEELETAEAIVPATNDPFSQHLCYDLDNALYEVVANVPQTIQTMSLTWPVLGNITCQIPYTDSRVEDHLKTHTSILEDKECAKCGSVPKMITSLNWDALHVKSQIQCNIGTNNTENRKHPTAKDVSALTALQKELFSIINNYQDLYYSERTFSNADEIRFSYCLHVINHALKTRLKVLQHNSKIAKMKCNNVIGIPDECRDQGLVRPKTLILVPFRHSCLKIVESLISILIGHDKGGSVVNKKRFMDEFGGNELVMPKKNPKPEDYELTFKGNTDDTFKIGIAITKKTIKLYTEFYKSDIIIASTLGLRMLIGADGEADRDYDFLSSIELLIIDQTDIFLMQNWDHMLHVLDHLHLQPKESHDTDFSRVRSWCINGWSKYYRQTLIFSSNQLPEIHAIFNKKCFNYAGKVKVLNPVLSGSICQIVVQVPLIFHRFETLNHSDALQNRMEFFISKILPQYKDTIMNHTLIYVPSYYDFVKLRNFFNKEELSFVQICEYSKDGKVARARDIFFHSDAHYLLYSERFHFFRRIRIKGIRHIIFYAPPSFAHFYSELCNLMQEANQNPYAGSKSNMTVTTLYCKYDALQLSAIVGTERASKMLVGEQAVQMLMTGE